MIVYIDETGWKVGKQSCYTWVFSTIAEHVAVAHPGHLRLIFRSKQKNDRCDAEKLAKLLYLGEVPMVHVPSADVRVWQAVRRSPTAAAYMVRIGRGDKDRRKIAIVASRISHSLMRQ